MRRGQASLSLSPFYAMAATAFRCSSFCRATTSGTTTVDATFCIPGRPCGSSGVVSRDYGLITSRHSHF